MAEPTEFPRQPQRGGCDPEPMEEPVRMPKEAPIEIEIPVRVPASTTPIYTFVL